MCFVVFIIVEICSVFFTVSELCSSFVIIAEICSFLHPAILVCEVEKRSDSSSSCSERGNNSKRNNALASKCNQDTETIQKIQIHKAGKKKLPGNKESCGGDSGRMEGIQNTTKGGI